MENIDFVAVGKRIRVARKKKNFTQAKLAEEVEISNSYMSGIERGKCICSLTTIVNIAKVLEVSLDYLVFGINILNVDSSFKELLEGISKEDHDLFFSLCENNAKALKEDRKKKADKEIKTN